MTKLENRCANCGGKFGLVYHNHWGLRFCRKACKDDFLAKTAKECAHEKVVWTGRILKGEKSADLSAAGSSRDRGRI